MSTLYKIKLQNFEGPLDLLLFFVRKDELNIYDIPIARITKSYLEYLQLMQDLNLDIASEFILMAATLMRIKVKMMLPKDPVAEDEEEMMDPREELSRRLIEYRQFKEASKSLSELDEYWRQVYRRSYFNFDLLPQNEEEAIGLKDISFFDLLAAYKKALEKKPIQVFHNVERLNVTVEEQQKYIMAFFRDRTCYLFTELCEDMAKIEIVVTFLALLDLVKRAEIAIKQASVFDDIWIYKASEFKDEEIPESERAAEEVPILSGAIPTENIIPDISDDSVLQADNSPEAEEIDSAVISETPEVQANTAATNEFENIENIENIGVDTNVKPSEVGDMEARSEEVHYETVDTLEVGTEPLDTEIAVHTEANGVQSVVIDQEQPESNEIDGAETPTSSLAGDTVVEKIREDVVPDIESMSTRLKESSSTDTKEAEKEIVSDGADPSTEPGRVAVEKPEETAESESASNEGASLESPADDFAGENEKWHGKVSEEEEPVVLTVEPMREITKIESAKEETPEIIENSEGADTHAESSVSGWRSFLNKIVSLVRRIFKK